MKKFKISTETPNVSKIALKSSSFLSDMPTEAAVSAFYQYFSDLNVTHLPFLFEELFCLKCSR